ncbi:MAG: YceI family protein [Candidatus Dormibacteraeota bacterium]|nr:YceI family protein [Candidatus Dormibacteraeota bacterium]
MSWTLDRHHTSVAFSAKHLGVATVRGHFNKVDAQIELDDPEDPTTGRGSVTIDAASITTDNDQRDGHLRSADFFDVEKYPTIRFEAKSVTRSGNNFKVAGDLTIKDVTKEIALDYEHGGVVVDPYGNKKVGGTLTGSFNRTDWDLMWNVPLGGGGLLVGERINLEVDGELAEDKEAAAESAQAEAAV